MVPDCSQVCGVEPPCASWGNADPLKHHCNATLADARWVKAQAAARKAAGPQWGRPPQAGAEVSAPMQALCVLSSSSGCRSMLRTGSADQPTHCQEENQLEQQDTNPMCWMGAQDTAQTQMSVGRPAHTGFRAEAAGATGIQNNMCVLSSSSSSRSTLEMGSTAQHTHA